MSNNLIDNFFRRPLKVQILFNPKMIIWTKQLGRNLSDLIDMSTYHPLSLVNHFVINY